MRETVKKIKALGLACLFALACGATAGAQQPEPPVERLSAEQALVRYEQLLEAAADPLRKFHLTGKAAPAALAAGEKEKAKAYAVSLLGQAGALRDNWDYGNALHVGNLILGRLALEAGDVAEAGRRLLEAGRTPGSPQLNSFGPNMYLAKELLAKGEQEAVARYLDLCAKFWASQGGRLDAWKAAVRKGETPDFGPSLTAHMSHWRYERWDRLVP